MMYAFALKDPKTGRFLAFLGESLPAIFPTPTRAKIARKHSGHKNLVLIRVSLTELDVIPEEEEAQAEDPKG